MTRHQRQQSIREAYRCARTAREFDSQVRAIAQLCEAQTGRKFDPDEIIAAVRKGEPVEAVLARFSSRI